MTVKSVHKPFTDETYPNLSDSNLIIALPKVPYGNCKVVNMIKKHMVELYTTERPYSSVVNNLAKIGKVIKDRDLCKIEQII